MHLILPHPLYLGTDTRFRAKYRNTFLSCNFDPVTAHFKRPSEKDSALVCGYRPVAHNRRVGVSLACEGDSVPLQDRARLNGQGHCRWICKIQGERVT